MKTEQESLLWRVAVHEAGHTAFAAHSQWYINSVELIRKDACDATGEVDVDGPLDLDRDFPPEEIVRWQTYYGAGAAAELIVLGDRLESGLDGDRDCHRRMNEKFNISDDFENAIQRAVVEIRDLDLIAVAEYFRDEMGQAFTLSLDQPHQSICDLLSLEF